MSAYDVVIVGGGQGGAQAALALRANGFAGSIAIVGDEPAAPYDRTTLTKQYLSGEKTAEEIALLPADAWQDKAVELVLGQRVESIDASARAAVTTGGRTLNFERLIWAAGARPRLLTCDGADLEGVHTLRAQSDVDHLRSQLAEAQRIIIVGGGYLGLEAAASLRTLGKSVCVLEAESRVLARVAGAALSSFYEGEHRRRGVDIRTNAKVSRLEGKSGRVDGVALSDGEVLEADLVIVAIGVLPNIEALRAAGAAGDNGVRVDEQCRTSLEHVFAIGDCAEHRNRFAGDAWIRAECVQNASDQAATAADALMGGGEIYNKAPRFWSDQYDLKLLSAGFARDYDEEIVRGDPLSGSFSIAYLRSGVLVAVDSVNCVKDHTQARALVTRGVKPDRARLADPQTPLKQVEAS